MQKTQSASTSITYNNHFKAEEAKDGTKLIHKTKRFAVLINQSLKQVKSTLWDNQFCRELNQTSFKKFHKSIVTFFCTNHRSLKIYKTLCLANSNKTAFRHYMKRAKSELPNQSVRDKDEPMIGDPT